MNKRAMKLIEFSTFFPTEESCEIRLREGRSCMPQMWQPQTRLEQEQEVLGLFQMQA